MRKLFFAVPILLLSIISTNIAIADSSPYQFLRYQSSARGAALAGCLVSMPGDASALVFNPAAAYTVEEKMFSATFLKHVLDINSGLVSYIHRLEGGAVMAGAVSYTNYGSFDKADIFGVKSGSFSANDISAGFTYANELDSNLYYGVTGKLIFITLEEESSIAFAVDAGILYQLPDGRSNIGLSILHAGAQVSKIGSESESLPLDIRAGINHRLRGLPLLVNFSLHHLADETDSFFDKFTNFSIAGELYVGKYIQLRLGYDNMIRRYTSIETDRKFSGFSGGVGIKANDFNFDYGIALYGSSATMHRFSVGLDF